MADEGPALWGDAALRVFPDAFDERQRPKCGHWSEHFGPCVCGDPKRHEERREPTGAVPVRPTKSFPGEAWLVESGDDALRAAAAWSGCADGIWGEDSPDQVVWLRVDALQPGAARPGDWIVKTALGVRVLTAEEFADQYEVIGP